MIASVLNIFQEKKKKSRGVEGEKKVWSLDMHCIPRVPQRCPQPPRQSLALLLGLLGESWRTSYLVKGNSSWKCLAKCCVIFDEISHPEWEAGERRVAGVTALLNTQAGAQMASCVWVLKWIVWSRFWNHFCDMLILQQIAHWPTIKAHWNVFYFVKNKKKREKKKETSRRTLWIHHMEQEEVWESLSLI